MKKLNKKQSFSTVEIEAIFLNAIIELIDSMVNFEIFEVFIGDDIWENHPLTLYFKSSTHKKYFNIMLVDFLSLSDLKILGIKKSYITALKDICENPQFCSNNPIKSLKDATNNFSSWLDTEIKVKVNEFQLSDIDLEIDLLIKRVEFIKICGNISKHNFTRLSRVTNELKTIFKRSGKDIEDLELLTMRDQFYERFHDDIFEYHSNTVAEFLNNIRWGIYEYLQPQSDYHKFFINSIKNGGKWSYEYPKGITNNFAKTCYWNLINNQRWIMKKFEITKWLKKRY